MIKEISDSNEKKSLIIAKVKKHIILNKTKRISRRIHALPREQRVVLTGDQIEVAQEKLQFLIPDILIDIYTTVADGGIGPGNGLFSLNPYSESSEQSAIDWYLSMRKEDEIWPVGLLPICDWGCSIFSSVWCTLPNYPIVRHDLNWTKSFLEGRPGFQEMLAAVDGEAIYSQIGSLWGATWVEAKSLDAWIWAWASGKDVLSLGYPSSDRSYNRKSDGYMVDSV